MILNETKKLLSALYVKPFSVTNEFKIAVPENRYFIIPGKNGPRWIVPENQKLGLPILRQWHPYGVKSIIKWRILIAAYQFGALSHINGIEKLCIVGTQPFIGQDLWGNSISQTYTPVVYVGTPGASQKVIATVINNQALKSICVIKTPIGRESSKKIIREVQILNNIRDEKSGIAPKVFFVDKKNGVACQEAIKGRLTERKMTPAHISWLAGMTDGKTTTINEHLNRLKEVITYINMETNYDGTDCFKKIFKKIADSTLLPSVWFHGDFAPWNLKWGKSGLCAIDWEDAQRSYLPLQDFLHFYVIQAYLFGAKKDFLISCLKSHFAVEYCRLLEIPESKIIQLTLFYLINSWAGRFKEKNFRHANFLLSLTKDFEKAL